MQKSVKELFIDVSEYDAPQPFEEVIQLLQQMKSGEYIRMLHRKKPLPLLQLLQEHGFNFIINELLKNHTARNTSNLESWEIIIWIKKDKIVSDYCTTQFQT